MVALPPQTFKYPLDVPASSQKRTTRTQRSFSSAHLQNLKNNEDIVHASLPSQISIWPYL